MARAEKVAAVEALTAQMRESTAVLVTEYRGLSVSQLAELRGSLGPGVSYTVAKNTLVRRAVQESGVTGIEDLLQGPTALAFVSGDAVEAAKGIRDFAKNNSALVIKGGVMDGEPLTVPEILKIADLESREVLLAKLAGAMTGSLTKAAQLFNAPASQAARAVAALQEQKASQEQAA